MIATICYWNMYVASVQRYARHEKLPMYNIKRVNVSLETKHIKHTRFSTRLHTTYKKIYVQKSQLTALSLNPKSDF